MLYWLMHVPGSRFGASPSLSLQRTVKRHGRTGRSDSLQMVDVETLSIIFYVHLSLLAIYPRP